MATAATLERKGLSVELKAGDKGEFTARIVTLNIPDKDNDVTPPGAFPPATDVLVSAYGHASWGGALPVGIARIQESGQEVLADGRFNLATTIGRDTYETVKFTGPLQEWSYGFKVLESGQDTVDGKPVRILKRVQPFEISPVLKGSGVLTATLDIKSLDEMKPYPSEHACRLREPSDFQADSFRRTSRRHEGKSYDVIMGRLKGETSMTEQAYRYPKGDWPVTEARAHCKAHDGKTFEPASGGKDFCEPCLEHLAAIITETKSALALRLSLQALTPAEQNVLSNRIGDLEDLLDELKALNTPRPDAGTLLLYLTSKARLMAMA